MTGRFWAVLALAGSLVAAAGCSTPQRPYVASREILGTAVSVSAYGPDKAALKVAVDAAFAEMLDVEAELDPYDTTSTIAAFNATPYEWHPLPDAAVKILDDVERLGVGTQFSPALFGVTNLYDFGGKGTVPTTATLSVALAQARGFVREASRARFAQAAFAPPPPGAETSSAAGLSNTMRPGLDFGGAAKGLAIDRAMAALRRAGGATGAMISAGSSTQVWGAKTDGQPWRVGIEDPRETGTVLAVVGSTGPEVVNISTSGDYQLYFERNGIRYHHILDPATGRPARGLQSLTVYGRMSGMDADILSTAVFVMGPSAAREWAARNGVGLYAVDDRGRAISVSAPKGAGLTFERAGSPTR